MFGIRERFWNVRAVGASSLDEAVVERLQARLLEGGAAGISEISCCMLTGAVEGRRSRRTARNHTARSARAPCHCPLLPCLPFEQSQ